MGIFDKSNYIVNTGILITSEASKSPMRR